jgi:TfoX/Sxy family transcriptional regulator of competence genes
VPKANTEAKAFQDRAVSQVTMSYYQLPARVYNDLGQLNDWVEASVAAARRAKHKS